MRHGQIGAGRNGRRSRGFDRRQRHSPYSPVSTPDRGKCRHFPRDHLIDTTLKVAQRALPEQIMTKLRGAMPAQPSLASIPGTRHFLDAEARRREPFKACASFRSSRDVAAVRNAGDTGPA